MIFVDRDRVDSKAVPIKPSAEWFASALAREGLAKQEREAHQVSKLYSHDEVKKALAELFHYKCAYCEQPLGEEWDVEHYRPKGRVAESPIHPGYYWLAYRWVNLYPSCKHCNQKRKGAPTWDDPVTRPPAGKLDQFPLLDELRRVMDPDGDLGAEAPLLLDPCREDDRPEEHFFFDPQGGIGASGLDDPRAEATIRLCNLGRNWLCRQRGQVVVTVARIVALCERAREDATSDEVVAMLEDLLAEKIHASAFFAAVARYVVKNPGTFEGLNTKVAAS